MLRVVGWKTAKEFFAAVRTVEVRTKVNGKLEGSFPVWGSCIWGIERAEKPFIMTEMNRNELSQVGYPYLVELISIDGGSRFKLPTRCRDNSGGFEIITPVIHVNNPYDIESGLKGYFSLPREVKI